jgi:acetyl esterase/lipase
MVAMETHAEPFPNAQAHAYLESLQPWVSFQPVEMRRWMRELSFENCGPAEPVAVVEDIDAGGVSSRFYASERDVESAFVWMHGGGWTVGDPDCYDTLARALANRVRCAVLSVDYRLAPEHPYPAAVEDCWAATCWATDRFARVAVGGDSAGGNLAAVTALRARDRGLPLNFQLLVYPTLDYTAVDGPYFADYRVRYARFAGKAGYGVEITDAIRDVWESYIPEPTRRSEQDASPLLAETLTGVAPAMVILAEHDVLSGEGRDYAARLQSDGVQVEVREYPGQVHGFFQLLGTMDDAHDAVDHVAAALGKALLPSATE